MDGANWKLRNLLRTKRYYDVPTMIEQYKVRILGFIEYRTAGVYHCCSTLLSQIDRIQNRLLNQLGVSNKEALLEFRLAPLNARRDMGMLGVIHRAVLGEGPDHFRKHFVLGSAQNHYGREGLRRHGKQLQTFRRGKFLDIAANSILGLIDVYNLLPAYMVEATSVKEFQTRLQRMMRDLVTKGQENWETLYSLRKPLEQLVEGVI